MRLVQVTSEICTKSVDALLDLDERAEIGQFADPAFDHGADGVAIRDRGPRIGFELLHAERDAAVFRLHIQNHGLHLIAHLDDLARVLHAPAPGHLRDMDQTFDAGLEFDKGAVISDAHHAAHHAAAGRVVLHRRQPGIGGELLDAERNAFLVLVELQNFERSPRSPTLSNFGRMRDTAIGDVADVQQSVNSAEVDEGAIVGEILDRSGDHRAFMQKLQARYSFGH